MYSCEDRIRAVRLYIKLGRRVAATIRQLDYPTKNSLKSWHRKFELGLDLPAGYARSKPKYSHEQKRLAVDHTDAQGAHACCRRSEGASPGLRQAAVIALCTRRQSAQEIAQRLGVCGPTLYNWRTSYWAARFLHP